MSWLVRRYGQQRPDAEDLAHDAILKVLRLRDKYDPAKGKVETWLFQIAKRMVFDAHRRRRRARTVSLDEVSERALPTAENPAVEYARKAQNTKLYRALRRVPKAQRFPVILHVMDQYSYPKTASSLGITLEQARYAVKLGLAALRRLLRE